MGKKAYVKGTNGWNFRTIPIFPMRLFAEWIMSSSGYRLPDGLKMSVVCKDWQASCLLKKEIETKVPSHAVEREKYSDKHQLSFLWYILTK